MAVKLSESMSKTKVVNVKWADEDLDVSYFPNVVTPDLLEKVAEASKRDDLSVMGTMLEPVIEWWDIITDDGNRLPCNQSTIGGVPLSLLNAISETIQADQNPPDGNSSDAS